MKRKMILALAILLAAGLTRTARAQNEMQSSLQVASAARTHGSTDSEDASSVDLFSSNGRSVRFYAGYDYSLLDDLVNGVQQLGAYYKSGAGVTVGTSTDRSGVVMGVEWGQRLDGGSELSLATEVVSSQADSLGQANPTNVGGETVGPNMVDATLRYSFDLVRGSGNRTSLSLGGGWYHAIIDFNSSLS